MIRPALPATEREDVTDIDPLRCVGCNKVIFNTYACVIIRNKMWCNEVCASQHALKKLRNSFY